MVYANRQTQGKKFPYLFSQCQPIYARTLLPVQDSPSVKIVRHRSISLYSFTIAHQEWVDYRRTQRRSPQYSPHFCPPSECHLLQMGPHTAERLSVRTS